MKNSIQHSKTAPHKWLRFASLFLAATLTIPLTGCSEAHCANGSGNPPGSGFLSEIPQKVQQAVEKMNAAVSEIIGNIESALAPTATEPTEAPVEDCPSSPYVPHCPPFEEKLGVVTAYEDLMILNSGDAIEAACVSAYAKSPEEYHEELYAEFVRHYGYEPHELTRPTYEFVGQFFVDGKDYQPIYKVILFDTSVPLWDNPPIYIQEYTRGNTTTVSCSVVCELWANGNSFDGDSDCWTSYQAFLQSEEFQTIRRQIAQRLSELTGVPAEELLPIHGVGIAKTRIIFASRVRNSQREMFSFFTIAYDYTPPTEEE